MNKVTITPRTLSRGELAELKRLQQYTISREKTRRPGKYSATSTMALRPPKTSYGSLNLAPDNDTV